MGPLFVFFAAMMLTAFLFWLSHLAWNGILSDIAVLKSNERRADTERREMRRAIVIMCDDILLVLNDMSTDTSNKERKVNKIIDRIVEMDPELKHERRKNV